MPNATAVCLPHLAAACPCSSSTANLLPHLAPSPHPPAAFSLLSLLHRHSTKLRWISQEKTPTRSKTRLKINNEAEPHHGTVQSELRRWERYKPNNLRKSNLAVNVASGESRQLVISSTIPENDSNLGCDWESNTRFLEILGFELATFLWLYQSFQTYYSAYSFWIWYFWFVRFLTLCN